MTKTYVIADLHGRRDLLNEALDHIAKQAERGSTIITLGDYIDRGPDSAGIIYDLMELHVGGADGCPFKLICLTGNHEQIMLETIRKPLHPEWWIANGGGATLMSYGHPARGDYNPGVVPKEHLDWLAALPLFYSDKHRVYVHAGVEPNTPLQDQHQELLTWRIYPKDADGGLFEKGSPAPLHVVHGHEQHKNGPKFFLHRTNLDCMAYETGRLVIGVFDDDVPGGPVELIEVFDDGRPAKSSTVSLDSSKNQA